MKTIHAGKNYRKWGGCLYIILYKNYAYIKTLQEEQGPEPTQKLI